MTTPDGRTAPGSTPGVPTPAAAPAGDDDYSATGLASHWIERPEPDTAVLEVPTGTATPGDGDATVLRFGPGVTAALAHRPHATLPAAARPAPPAAPPRRLRRHALPALVLAAAVTFLFWREHAAAPLAVREVTVTAARHLACDETADIVGVVRTDGRAGTFSYQWVRNDGTTSEVLRATVAGGRQHTRLSLLWAFQGRGSFTAEAELRVLSPAHRSAAARFSYDCP
jgi:hypothetical protein